MKKTKYFTLLILVLLMSCNKLDIKPDLSRVIPSTLEDFQGILDNSQSVFNLGYFGYGEIAANDFYVTFKDFQSNYTPLTSEIYIWNISDLDDPYFSDWNLSYQKVSNSNIVLEGLQENNFSNSKDDILQNVKGQALFNRAQSYYMLAEEFAPVYSSINLDKPSIPLRIESDINLSYKLSTVGETYSFILNDLKLASAILPEVPLYKTRASKPAAFALLARVYLSMDDYPNALKYADSCLNIYSKLLDYNNIDQNSEYPISQFNDEVIIHSSMIFDDLLTRNVLKVQSNLIQLYENNDLRKKIFFAENNDNSFRFKGNYNGLEYYTLFSGIAVDEVFLISSECHARLNNIELALKRLNTLLAKRYNIDTFVPITISNQENLIRKVLEERRKELVFRGIRWTDLRRLNKDPRYAVTLRRELNGVKYNLPPNDKRYVFPIPKYVTSIQN